jgi:hypothetical protein
MSYGFVVGGVTGGPGTTVDDVDDGVVVDVVVVVVVFAWHTEMFTVLPLATCTPAAGVWLSTLPGCALLAHVVSKVVLATRPAPLMADWAEDDVWPTTPGTPTQLDTWMLTELLGWAGVFGAGDWAATSPAGY